MTLGSHVHICGWLIGLRKTSESLCVKVEISACFFEVGVLLLTDVFELFNQVNANQSVQDLQQMQHKVKAELIAFILDHGNQVLNRLGWHHTFEELVRAVREPERSIS